MTHTPGPWHLWVGRRIVDIVANDRAYGICRMLPNTDGPASDDALLMSNARILAAAPDLVAALEPFAALSTALVDRPDEHPLYGFNDATITYGDIRRARAAVAKARGG